MERTGINVKGIPDISLKAIIPISEKIEFYNAKKNVKLIYTDEDRKVNYLKMEEIFFKIIFFIEKN